MRERRARSVGQARRAVAQIAQLAELHDDPPPESGLTSDPKDDYLVALARATGADYLISGDQHLTELANPRPAVLTPRALLDQLETRP